MAQNITLLGASYSAVPAVQLPKTGGGTATFTDVTDTTAAASDVASGKYFYTSAGVKTQGTASGGGGSPTIESLSITPTTSQQTFNSSSVDGYKPVTVAAMPSGTAGTPTAAKGTVSNHSISVIPSVTNTTGYITGSTKTGTAVTVSASELVSGSETKTANGTYDVTNLAELVVNVSGGSGKNAQIASGVGRVATTAYTAVTGQSLTVAKTGTYDVYWCGYRSSTSGTNGSQLYIGNSAYGNATTTFDGTYTNWQIVHLSGVSLTADQTITVRARARGTSYYMYIANLTIIEA